MASLSDLYVIAAPLDHPEGIATGPDGELYAGGEAGQVYRIDQAAGAPIEIANTGGFVLGLCHDAAGTIYVCNVGETPGDRAGRPGHRRRSTPGATSADGGPLETPNWCAFAPDGTLWFTDSGTEALDIQNGRLIRVPPGGGDGEVVDLGRPLHFPNGMCVDADGVPAFLETLTPRLSRVVDGRAELVADLDGHLAGRRHRLRGRRLPGRVLLPVPAAVRSAGGWTGRRAAGRPTASTSRCPPTSRSTARALTKLAIGSLGGHGGQGHRPRHRRHAAQLPGAALERSENAEAAERLGGAAALGDGLAERTFVRAPSRPARSRTSTATARGTTTTPSSSATIVSPGATGIPPKVTFTRWAITSSRPSMSSGSVPAANTG